MQRGILDIFFKIVSVLGHPILIPTYLSLITNEIYGLSSFTVLGFTFVFPMIVILFVSAIMLKSEKKQSLNEQNIDSVVSEMSDSGIWRLERIFDSTRSRTMALNVELVSAILGYFLFKSQQMMALVMIFVAIASLSCMLINNFWRISIHSFGWGFAMFVIFKYLPLYYNGFVVAMIAVLVCGLVLSSRLYLGRHNNLQVHLGFFIGLSVPAVLYLALAII